MFQSALELREAGFQRLVQKMGRAGQHTKKFVVGHIGSSVCAGHDNCHVDAYASQLEALLKPLFEQAGVKFQSRNAGIGGACGDMFANQVYCLEHLVGSDADAVSFNWGYFGNSHLQQEDFVRIALSMPDQAMPIVTSLGANSTQMGTTPHFLL